MKIICMYLPQYHAIAENDKWWGEGYTEWTAVKNAIPMFTKHNQPKVPLGNNYYDLLKDGVKTWKWQAELAKKYGIYGFCIYHYWFEGKQLLEKPMEILRDNPDIDIRYSVCWANESWRKNWYGQKKELLMEQTYGGQKAWERHFDYLLTFFKDKRYIKKNNKPILHIYHSQEIVQLDKMLLVWNQLAKENGFDGIYLISGVTSVGIDTRRNLVDAYYYFEPSYTIKNDLNFFQNITYYSSVFARRYINKIFHKNLLEHIVDIKRIWKRIESRQPKDYFYPGTFPAWDNTPRTGTIGFYYKNSTSAAFSAHIQKMNHLYKNKDGFLYINAWNEWGEGAYLEPDEMNKYGYLESLKGFCQK